MRIATYNIRKGIGLDRRRNPGRVMDVINALGADIVVLQEADRRLGPRPAALPFRLIEQHSDFEPVRFGESGPSLGFHGNAILVRKGTGVTAITAIDLPGLEPRGAVSVEIGGRIRISGLHLGLMRRHRRAQIAQLKRALNGIAIPTAILGDFNEWSPSVGLEELEASYMLHSPGRTYHAARPVAGLDRIALSPDISLRDAGVAETRQSRIASDHLPVWADIALT